MPRQKINRQGPFGDVADKTALAETTVRDKNRFVQHFKDWRKITYPQSEGEKYTIIELREYLITKQDSGYKSILTEM